MTCAGPWSEVTTRATRPRSGPERPDTLGSFDAMPCAAGNDLGHLSLYLAASHCGRGRGERHIPLRSLPRVTVTAAGRRDLAPVYSRSHRRVATPEQLPRTRMAAHGGTAAYFGYHYYTNILLLNVV